VWRFLVREGWDVNLKRVHRIWKQEGLRVPPKARKKRRLGTSENGTQWLAAERINHVWSYDFVFDQTESGGRLKWLPVLDEFTRSDNEPEFVANAVKDWIEEKGFKSESFNARFRDEFLNVESFMSLLEAKVMGEEHRDKYNHRCPHS
jgi:transposase InsO family protein